MLLCVQAVIRHVNPGRVCVRLCTISTTSIYPPVIARGRNVRKHQKFHQSMSTKNLVRTWVSSNMSTMTRKEG